MRHEEWTHVPIRRDAERWATRRGLKKVLVVAHTVTSMQRLIDVLPVLEHDSRVQLIFTQAPDVFSAGVADLIQSLGGIAVPWRQAIATRFDLALTASVEGIGRLRAPVALFPHGIGFNKRAGRPDTGDPDTVFGLDRAWLTEDGRLVPAAVVLAHDAERRRLAVACPQAVPAAVVAGDPSCDRILASLPDRAEYRRAIGVAPDESLIVAASTWGPDSLVGARFDIVERLVAEAAGSGRRAALLMHPNAWNSHGQRQWQAWMAPLVRAGLMPVPPTSEWRSALVACDGLIGDHGSTALYATLLGVPILLSGTGEGAVAPDSPMAELAGMVPRVRDSEPLLVQLAAARRQSGLLPIRGRAAAARITSHPGAFAARIRSTLYGLLDLTEPDEPSALGPLQPFCQPGSGLGREAA